MKIEHVYVRPDGVICACIVPLPEHKEPKGITGHITMLENQEALQSCKDSAVRFEDQKEAELEILEEWFAQSDEDDSWAGLKPDTLYPLSCEVEIMLQVRHGIEWHDLPGQNEGRDPEGIYQKVARLITDSKEKPVQEESQEELFRQVIEIFNAQRQVYGRPDYDMLKEEFTITRKP